MPSGPELSNTRLTMFPPEGRLRLDFDRERDLEDLMLIYFRRYIGEPPRSLPARRQFL